MLLLKRILLRLAAFLSLALGASAALHAEVPLQTCVAPLVAGTSDSAAEFYSCGPDQTQFGPGDFHVQLKLKPTVSDHADPLVLRMGSVWQDSARVRFRYADGYETGVAFSSADARRFITIGAIFEIPVPARSAPLVGIGVDIRQSANWRGVLIGAKLLTRSESIQIQSWLIALYAAFGGLSVALLAYNLSLWVVLGHRFQLVYAGMVGSMMVYAFSSSSLAMFFLPWLDNNDRLRINAVFLAMSAVVALKFMRNFFGVPTIGSRLALLMNWVTGFTMCVALAFAILAPWQGKLLDNLYMIVCSATLLLVAPILWCAWRTRVRHLGLFAIAWSPPIIVSILRALSGFGLIRYNFWLDNGNLIALSIESLLSTMLIIARLRDISTDRDRARASEQVAMRLANTDPLTGLLNRRSFLSMAMERSQRQRLMLIDIDHFKAINDRAGHETGDEVLRLVAKAIQSVRPADSLAVRLGGEEFALLVPEERAFLCSPELVLEAVRCQPMPLGCKVTASLGFAEGLTDSELHWKRLYRLADAALYRAKSDGRDRACHATDFEEKRPLKNLLATKAG